MTKTRPIRRAAEVRLEWGWATGDWKPGDPQPSYPQPITQPEFTEEFVRGRVLRSGGTLVVRTVYTAPEPSPWKEVQA